MLQEGQGMWKNFTTYKKIIVYETNNTAQKVKFSIKDFFSKCNQICSFRQTRSHLLKKSLMKYFIFCAV